MSKIMTFFSIVAGLFTGGCIKTFEVVELKNAAIEPFFENYNINSPEIEQYRFGNVLLSAYFSQNPSKGYDLRLSVWSELEGEDVTVMSASISPLDINTNLQRNIIADNLHAESGLFFGHKVLIEQLNEDDLYKYGGEGGTVNVNVSAKRGGAVTTFSYSFTAEKKRIGAPIH